MTTQQISSAQISTAYQQFRGIPLENLATPSPSVIKELAKSRQLDLAGKDLSKMGVGLTLLVRLAHSTSEQEFGEALNNGQLPPMKLNAEEMEIARGGLAGTLICVGAVIVGGIVGYFSRA